jgi:hypothetical protein
MIFKEDFTMGEIMKQTDEIKVATEGEAKALIESFKDKAAEEGFEITSYTSTLKEKKSKGEVIDSFYIVKIVKRW